MKLRWHTNLAIFLLSLSLYGTNLALAQCPQVQPPCRCAPSIYEPVAIICENAGSLSNVLAAITQARNTAVDSLLILDTAIPSIPANAFQSFTILRLVLNRCTLSQIDDNAFNGPLLDSLVELDLSDNLLGGVPQTGVPRLRNLRKLYLNRNRISRLEPSSFASYESRDLLQKLELASNRLTDQGLGDSTVFRPLRSLQELSLETNALTVIPSSSLVNQRQTLTNLNLGLNQINDVPVGALDFPNLNSLSLEFNGITRIAPEAFQGIPSLQFLYLTGNKFPSWLPEMFRYIGQLRTLGIGETPISVIPQNAFQHIPNLIRLEMSEAAVDTIEQNAFQRTPQIQAIVLNKNRISVVRAYFFRGLNQLYSVDLGGNRIEQAEPLAFADLPALRHLDISFNQLQTLPDNTFMNSFQPVPNDRRVMYVCGNPWLCDVALQWFRAYLRDNVDIDIEKPGCTAVCVRSIDNCPPEGTPLRAIDFCQTNDQPLALVTGSALSMVSRIILAIIMAILTISICLMGTVKWAMSRRRKKQKDQEAFEDEQRIMSSAASAYQAGAPSVIARSYAPSAIDLDLPQAHTLDDRPSNYLY